MESLRTIFHVGSNLMAAMDGDQVMSKIGSGFTSFYLIEVIQVFIKENPSKSRISTTTTQNKTNSFLKSTNTGSYLKMSRNPDEEVETYCFCLKRKKKRRKRRIGKFDNGIERSLFSGTDNY